MQKGIENCSHSLPVHLSTVNFKFLILHRREAETNDRIETNSDVWIETRSSITGTEPACDWAESESSLAVLQIS